MSTRAPTAAGQYHWVSMLAPSNSRRFLSYVIGWLTMTGWFAVVASVCFLCAQMLQGLALMTNASYTAMQWQIPLIYWLVLVFGVLFNTVAVRFLPQIEALVLILHVLGFFAILIPVAVYGIRTDAAVVFNTWLNSGNWPTQGVSFLIGLVGPAFGLLGGDAAVHVSWDPQFISNTTDSMQMSEEIKRPTINVPRAMCASVLINGALGFAMIIIQLFFLGDADAVFEAPFGFPFMTFFQQAVGSNGGAVAMVCIVFVLVMCCNVSCIATASRLTWAFARDRGLPFWSFWSRVDQQTVVPLLSVALVAIVSLILSVIAFGSTLAFNDVVSLTIANLFSSYFIGNTLLLWRRMTGGIEPYNPDEVELVNTIGATKLTWGPWKIPGIWGILNNAFGSAFLLIVLFFSFFPTATDPTPATMNWSILLAGGIAIIALGYYFAYGRRSYKGPVVESVGEAY